MCCSPDGHFIGWRFGSHLSTWWCITYHFWHTGQVFILQSAAFLYHIKAHCSILVQVSVTVFGSLAPLQLLALHCWFEYIIILWILTFLLPWNNQIFIPTLSVWMLWVWLQAHVGHVICFVVYITSVLLNNMGVVSYILEFWHVICTNSRMWWWTPI